MNPKQVLVYCVRQHASKGKRYVVARWNRQTEMYERPRYPEELNGRDTWVAGNLTEVAYNGGFASRNVAVRQAANLFRTRPDLVEVRRGKGYLGGGFYKHNGAY